jgi:hypothetical protein
MKTVIVAAVVAALTAAAPASAAVLVQAIPKRLVCGDAIVPGIWAQSGTKGSRTVRMEAIDRRTGHVWWRKTARATTRRWRTWTLPSGMGGRCRATTVVYRGHGFKATFHVRFRSERS